MTIENGTLVRSFDFADTFGGTHYGRDLKGERACYIEGVVEGIEDFLGRGYRQYKIRCINRVFGGKPTRREAEYFFPPLNGTPKSLGGVCNSVEEISR